MDWRIRECYAYSLPPKIKDGKMTYARRPLTIIPPKGSIPPAIRNRGFAGDYAAYRVHLNHANGRPPLSDGKALFRGYSAYNMPPYYRRGQQLLNGGNKEGYDLLRASVRRTLQGRLEWLEEEIAHCNGSGLTADSLMLEAESLEKHLRIYW